MPRRLLLVTLVLLALGASQAGAQRQVTLRIVFPEGFSARQMTDRVAEVRRIAIRKRDVTPALSGAPTRSALASPAPRAFRPYLKRRSIEGFLFPSLYEFTPFTSASELIGAQLSAFERTWRSVDLRYARARNLTPYDVLIIASMVERETAVARRAEAGRGGDLQPAEAAHAAGDRRHPALRARDPGHAAADEGSTSAATRPTTPAASRACRPPRSATRASPRCAPRRGRPRSTTCTTCASPTACGISSRPTTRSSAARHASTATAARR